MRTLKFMDKQIMEQLSRSNTKDSFTFFTPDDDSDDDFSDGRCYGFDPDPSLGASSHSHPSTLKPLTNTPIDLCFGMAAILLALAQLFQRQPPPNPPVEPQNQPPDFVLPIEPPLPPPNLQLQQNNLDFPIHVVAFCLAAANAVAIQSLQNLTVYPITFHLLCLMIMFAFASIFVAKYITPTKPNAACLLEIVGVLFGVTAFFIAFTISFPLWLRIISWIIYAVSLGAIIICNATTSTVDSPPPPTSATADTSVDSPLLTWTGPYQLNHIDELKNSGRRASNLNQALIFCCSALHLVSRSTSFWRNQFGSKWWLDLGYFRWVEDLVEIGPSPKYPGNCKYLAACFLFICSCNRFLGMENDLGSELGLALFLENGRGKVLEPVVEIQDRHDTDKEIAKSLLELH
ncbi:hypothetical protein Vadar_019344 [Vaccinium darrowii]|uniref:Uncharacterized protein n=1 Tax=Vaccinium darrowii TaxID=229202 RepID=A0ACB7Y803_9ERIC|nr:hypothetical protein Vadar_019344 [Vaccinium darrowii]